MNLEQLTTFFGCMAVINIALLLLSTAFITIGRRFTIKIHTQLFHMQSDELPRLYFQYLGFFKIGIIIFNIVPFIALKLVA